MDNQNREKKVFQSAEAFIAYLEKGTLVNSRRNLSAIPNSLMDEFDMFDFARNCRDKDMYTVLMNAEPFSEFDAFYNCLDTDRDKDMFKTFSFRRSEEIVKKYKELSDIVFDVATSPLNEVYGDAYEDLIAPLTEEEKKKAYLSKEEYEFFFNVSVQYEMEADRIIKVMEKLIQKGKEIATNAEFLTREETDKKQVELLILLEEAKDKSNMDAEKMLRTAMNIGTQTQLNVLQGPEMKN